MKNSPVPSPAPFRRLFNSSSRFTNVRAALVLALIAMVSSLPFYAFAQGGDGPGRAVQSRKSRTYTVAPDRGTYVIYAGPNGETVCRLATPDQARAMRNAGSSGLRQINHLKDDLSSNATTAGLTIILRATAQLEANQPAKQAFIAAAAKWEALIKDPITIAIDVDFGTEFFGEPFTGSNVIGATQSPQFFSPDNYPNVRQRLIDRASASELPLANALPAGTVPTDIGNVSTVLITSPLFRALGGFAPDFNNDPPDTPQPRIGFNSAFNFDLDPSDGITGNRTDFDAVAVHEIGHVLGFNSEVGSRELNPASALEVTIWDLFRFRPGTANLNTFNSRRPATSS